MLVNCGRMRFHFPTFSQFVFHNIVHPRSGFSRRCTAGSAANSADSNASSYARYQLFSPFLILIVTMLMFILLQWSSADFKSRSALSCRCPLLRTTAAIETNAALCVVHPLRLFLNEVTAIFLIFTQES